MKILSLDPSSQVTGYAVLSGLLPSDLLDAGLLKSTMKRGYLGKQPDWLLAHLRLPELAAVWRVLTLIQDAADLLEEHQPDRVLIEVPSGKAGTGSKKGASASLATYGMGAGAMLGSLWQLRPKAVVPVNERQWTRWRGEKFKHQASIAAMYRQYQPEADPGADLSDAIGLGRWWLIHQEPEVRSQEPESNE